MSLYLYALLDPAPRGPLGAGAWDEALRLAACGPFTALVGVLDSAPEVDEPSLRGHDAVVRRIASACDAMLPARYGNLAPDEATLAARLAPRVPELAEALELVRGREQMTVRVFAPEPEAGAGDRNQMPEPDAGVGPGTAWLRARARAAALPELAPLREAVASFVLRERAQRHSTPPLYASVYHLVRRGDAEAYLRALQSASARLAPMRAVASGPWPAYAFAPEDQP